MIYIVIGAAIVLLGICNILLLLKINHNNKILTVILNDVSKLKTVKKTVKKKQVRK